MLLRVLNVGCSGHPMPEWFGVNARQLGNDIAETRLDIDPACNPDIVASMTMMGPIGNYDALICSHALEHIHTHEVPVALKEFWRVLVRGGYAIVVVPDLEDVKPTREPLYQTHSGPVTGLDLIYGLGMTIDVPFMAHHTGFTADTLDKYLQAAGFSKVIVKRAAFFNLVGVGVK